MKETIMNKAQQRHSADGNFFGSFFSMFWPAADAERSACRKRYLSKIDKKPAFIFDL